MLNLSLVEACVLDFDDVVVRGSEALKHEAWKTVFPEPEHLAIQQRWSEHFANGKGSRFDIIQKTLIQLGVPMSGLVLETDNKAKIFNQAVKAGIIDIGVHSEDRQALEWLCHEGLRPYINSATPQVAIEETIIALGLHNLVAGVFGHQSSSSKIDNLRRVAEHAKVMPEKVLFVGDSDGDVRAAGQFGCHFVGISTNRNQWHEKRPELTFIDNLGQLPLLFKM